MTGAPLLVSAWVREGTARVLARESAPLRWAYLGENTARMLWWRQVLGAGRQVAVGRRTMERAREIRPAYLRWVSALGTGHEGTLPWLVSEVAERNIYTAGKLFLNLAYVALWRDLVAEPGTGRLIVVVESTALAETLARSDARPRVIGLELRRRLARLAYPARLVRAKTRYLAGLALRWATARRHAAPPAQVFDRMRPAVLVHTWAAPAERDGAGFADPYFGPLPAWLRARGEQVVLVPWFFRRTSYRRYLEEVGRSTEPALVPERALALSDLVRAASLPLLSGWLPRGRSFTWEGLDVSPLVASARRLAVLSFRPSDALLHYYLAGRLARSGVRVDRVIHIYESHVWEKALAVGARRFFPGATVVGFQHNAFSEHETNYCLAPEDVAAGAQPDRIVCQGPAWAGVLERSGFHPEMLRVGGALRFTHLWSIRPGDGGVDGRPTVLVTPAVDPAEAVDTLAKVLAALGPRPDLRVLIKTHPLSPAERLLDAAVAASGTGMVPAHFEVVAGRLEDWLPRTALLVYGSTTTGWEALVAGIPAVFVGRDCGLSFDPVRVTGESREAAFTVTELASAVERLLRRDPDGRRRAGETGARALAEWFCPVHDGSLAAFGGDGAGAGGPEPAALRREAR